MAEKIPTGKNPKLKGLATEPVILPKSLVLTTDSSFTFGNLIYIVNVTSETLYIELRVSPVDSVSLRIDVPPKLAPGEFCIADIRLGRNRKPKPNSHVSFYWSKAEGDFARDARRQIDINFKKSKQTPIHAPKGKPVKKVTNKSPKPTSGGKKKHKEKEEEKEKDEEEEEKKIPKQDPEDEKDADKKADEKPDEGEKKDDDEKNDEKKDE